jgi:replicative superfamily II helicase
MKVAETVPEFAEAFGFEEFNEMQAAMVPTLLDSDDNVVASAPTASGKTALAELAICRTLGDGGTALFVAPMRALTNEKESEWDRFEEMGYSVYVVTGERDLNPRRAERADILVMTPEKADSATRKHDTSRYAFVTDVDCVVIDEVHLLDADRRGATLEVVVSRLRRLCDPRVIALSATLPNVEDVAEWLDAPAEATFSFGEEARPVELNAGVETYTHGENAFADKYRRLYRALDLAEPHVRDDGQALVFVASRQDTVRAAEKARDEVTERDLGIHLDHELDLHEAAQGLENDTLAKSVVDGVGFHHAGLSKQDKDLVEEWFKQGHVKILFSTSTLAWGVNLPARCVVIRDTKHHDPLEGEVEMSPLDILQMLGRAGRPGYDDVGHGYVVCDRSDADRYRRLLREGKEIESRLAERLDAHLNAEVAMGTLSDLDDVMDWLETTFYHVRAESEPETYDFDGLGDRVQATLQDLVDRGFVERGDGLSIEPTPLGLLASKFYLRLGTAERFHALATDAEAVDADAMLETVAGAAEFDSVGVRGDERDAVHSVLSGRDPDLEGSALKVLAILHASTTGSPPGPLRSDAWVIRQNALRLLAALRAFLDRFAGARAANRASRVAARVEHGVRAGAVGLTAIDGVGSGRAQKLADEGVGTPGDVRAVGVEGLVDAGLSEGVAEQVLAGARSLPQVTVDWSELPDAIPEGERELHEVTVGNDADGARAGVRVTVNGVEMTGSDAYLGTTTVPVALFGADADELELAVEVAFPELPVHPVVERRTVTVD